MSQGLGVDSDADDERWRPLARQRFVGRVLAPLCVPIATLVMRVGYRWRIRDTGASRAQYARILRGDARPLLVAANHLTMADSALIAWGLGSTLQHVVEYRGLPWNVPEQARVESSWVWRVLAYLMKCVPFRAAAIGGSWRTCSGGCVISCSLAKSS